MRKEQARFEVNTRPNNLTGEKKEKIEVEDENEGYRRYLQNYFANYISVPIY